MSVWTAGNPRPRPRFTAPRSLGRGARLALIAPSSGLAVDHALESALTLVRRLGFEPVVPDPPPGRVGYLSGDDESRLRALHAALLDPEVDGLFCLRGGYGALRLLPDIDWQSWRRSRKPLLGYSDITALSLGLLAQSDLGSLHGPVAIETLSGRAEAEIRRAFAGDFGAGPLAAWAEAAEVPPSQEGLQILRGGMAEGPLIGGNASLLCRLVGTPYLPDLRGAILFLEDVGEPPYRIDGMVQQLKHSGILSQLGGLVLGQFTSPAAPAIAPSEARSFWADLLAGFQGPVLRGLRIGHFGDQATLPVGALVRLDGALGSLRLQDEHAPWAG